jgi:hypothetical protein
MEALGAAPVLNDGLVGGNAGLLVVRSSDTLQEGMTPQAACEHMPVKSPLVLQDECAVKCIHSALPAACRMLLTSALMDPPCL